MSKFEIIREVQKPDEDTSLATCVVRSNCYGSSVSFIQILVAEAREDFPDLLDEDIKIRHYAGVRYARTFGIEFIVKDASSVPERYREIRELELTY